MSEHSAENDTTAERDALAMMLADCYWNVAGATKTWEAWADALMARGVRIFPPEPGDGKTAPSTRR